MNRVFLCAFCFAVASGTTKLKEFTVENDVVRGIDENDGDLSNGRYARSVKFVATMAK